MRFNLGGMRSWGIRCVVLLSLFMFSAATSALAVPIYCYTYTGQPLNEVIEFSPSLGHTVPGPPLNKGISLQILSTSLLSPSSLDLKEQVSSISPEGSPMYDSMDDLFDQSLLITAVDADGLPTAWKIRLLYQNDYLKKGLDIITECNLEESLDSIVLGGGTRGWITASCSGPGAWTLTTQGAYPVPEPSSFVLSAAGLSILMVFMVWKRKSALVIK